MNKVYFTKLIDKVYLTSTPEEDNGFDWQKMIHILALVM
jgi:hypothetical protein